MKENDEIWKDVQGYEGLYKISNFGRCFSVLSSIYLKSHNNGKGYLFFPLRKNGKTKQFYVHRLIAMHFIDNPSGKPSINHINGIKNDNRIENLEWCTNSENILHHYHVLNNTKAGKGSPLKANFKKVLLFDDNENIIMEFESLRAAASYFNLNYTNLSSKLNGRRKLNINLKYEN